MVLLDDHTTGIMSSPRFARLATDRQAGSTNSQAIKLTRPSGQMRSSLWDNAL
jgi:hypothetical protein